MVARKAGQGMNWIKPDRRMALYRRDGNRCACCHAQGGPHGYGLTVDHIEPSARGGQNLDSNLITMCNRCNSVKQDKSIKDFLKSFLAPRGHDIKAIEARIAKLAATEIDRKEGKRLLEERKRDAAAYRKKHGKEAYMEYQLVTRRAELEIEKREEARLHELTKTGTPAQKKAAAAILKENEARRAKRIREIHAETPAEATKRYRDKEPKAPAKKSATKKAPAKKAATKTSRSVQRGKKGGKFILLPSGQKRYIK